MSEISKEYEEYTLSEGNGFAPPAPRLEFLYRLVADVSAPIVVGNVNEGLLKVIPITGGSFEGPKLKGEVLNAGADWNTTNLLDPTSKQVDTRYLLKTDDGALISLYTKGFQSQSKEVLERRSKREAVDPDEYYFKQHLYFQTSAEKYLWLNSVVAFGCVISRKTPGVIYDAWIVR